MGRKYTYKCHSDVFSVLLAFLSFTFLVLFFLVLQTESWKRRDGGRHVLDARGPHTLQELSHLQDEEEEEEERKMNELRK